MLSKSESKRQFCIWRFQIWKPPCLGKLCQYRTFLRHVPVLWSWNLSNVLRLIRPPASLFFISNATTERYCIVPLSPLVLKRLRLLLGIFFVISNSCLFAFWFLFPSVPYNPLLETYNLDKQQFHFSDKFISLTHI